MTALRCILALAVCIAGSASAKSDPATSLYHFANVIVPDEQASGTIAIPRNDPIVSARIFSEQPLRLVADARAATGEALVNAGAEAALARSNLSIACFLSAIKSPNERKSKFLCLLDQDRDNRFEGWFVGFDPKMLNRPPSRIGPVSKLFEPVSFDKFDAAEGTLLAKLVIATQGEALSSRKVVLCIVKPQDTYRGCGMQLGPDRIDKLPFETGLYQSKYQIVSIDDTTLTFQAVRPLTRQVVNNRPIN